ncbi:MAG: RHS repeat-associated core domain-containing protein [Saprospiraceae bacterium]|nr:RHS repeat-associated core domain-containing protein [Saprospiraceae bacterium]
MLDYAAEYYPYGKTMRDYTNGTKEKYETTQHERDQESGLDYRGARFYDGDIARFLSVDPLAKEYIALSPYNYVAGNPILVVDPDGKENILYVYAPNVSQRDEIIKSINKQSEKMGLNVKAVAVDFVPESSALDASDSFVFFTDSKNIKKDAASLENTKGYAFADGTFEGFTFNTLDVSNNPKYSEGDGNNLILIPFDNLTDVVNKANGKGFYKTIGKTESNFTGMKLEYVTANIILHGSGHNAGEKHETMTFMEAHLENVEFDGKFSKKKALEIMKTVTPEQLARYKEKYNATKPKVNLEGVDDK